MDRHFNLPNVLANASDFNECEYIIANSKRKRSCAWSIESVVYAKKAKKKERVEKEKKTRRFYIVYLVMVLLYERIGSKQ